MTPCQSPSPRTSFAPCCCAGPPSPRAAVDSGNSSLLLRLRAGEDEASRELVRLHGGRLLAFARRLMRKEEDVQRNRRTARKPPYRLLLRDIEEPDTAETAERLGMTQGAVKLRLHRARLALEEQVGSLYK